MKQSIEKESKSAWQRIEIVVNVANHCLLSIVCFYLIWYCFQDNWSELTCYHSLLCTLGFFCMTEGILMMYGNNVLVVGESKSTRTNFHWVLQALGAVFMISGATIEFIFRQMEGKIHFHATHAVIAIVTLVFLVLSTISGCSALFSQDFKRCLRPLFTKFAHHLFALTTFVSAVVAICYTLIQQKFTKRNDPGNLREVTCWMLAFIMLFTLIGPLKTVWAYSRSALNR